MNPNSPQSPFVVDQLRPVNKDGQTTATYELNKSSVNPQRIVGRDELGMPILDSIPTVYWRPFLMMDGCMNKVPLRTASVPSMHQDAVAYENETINDLVLAGCIPAWLCPYSTRYQHLIVGGSFVKVPHGEQDCGGVDNEVGCIHLQQLAERRKKAVLKKYNEDLEAFSKQKDQEYARMRAELVEGIGQAVGEALAKNAPPQQQLSSARQRLKGGETE
jgi:hypothetical protein